MAGARVGAMGAEQPGTVEWTLVAEDDGACTLTLAGRLDLGAIGRVWRDVVDSVDERAPGRLVVEAGGIESFDGGGVGLLAELSRRQSGRGGSLELRGLADRHERLWRLFDARGLREPEEPEPPARLVERAGRSALELGRDVRDVVAFLGAMAWLLATTVARPSRMRWRDALVVAGKVGADSFWIIALVGFLLGLILAFQSAILLERFGAEIFVADLVAVSLARELGPLMAAIVLAGRSGSAFAAEIGTMKVNEEIDALTTMGVDPVRFLALVRVVAATAMMPLMAAFMTAWGIVGGAVVLLSLGFPLVTYVNQVAGAVDVVDFVGGLVKAFVLGALVAGVGCLRGLRTRTGATAVGDSTTSAVVSGIVLIAVADGVFAMISYALGI